MRMSVSLPSVCVPRVWFNGRSARNIHVDIPDRCVCRYGRSTRTIFRDISNFSTRDPIRYNYESCGIIAWHSGYIGTARRLFNEPKHELLGRNYCCAQYSRFEAIWCSLLGLACGQFQQRSHTTLWWNILLDVQLLDSGRKECALQKMVIECTRISRWACKLKDEQRVRRRRSDILGEIKKRFFILSLCDPVDI